MQDAGHPIHHPAISDRIGFIRAFGLAILRSPKYFQTEDFRSPELRVGRSILTETREIAFAHALVNTGAGRRRPSSKSKVDTEVDNRHLLR